VKNEKSGDMSRRRFIQTAAVGTAAMSSIGILTAQEDTRPLKAGLIGAGKRGSGAVMDMVKADPTIQLVALADVFEDSLDASVDRLQSRKVAAENVQRFVGFDAYKKVLDMDLDIVLLATPPHFRAEHFAAAVDAGKHVFMEKPVAVDPVGAKLVIEAGEKAKQKGLSVAAGTQRRHEAPYLEMYSRVADGMIGEIVAMRCYWCGGPVRFQERQPEWSDMEFQLRNWFNYLWLAGDHIVEQHVHNVDVCNWFLGEHPVEALGMGARVQRQVGDIYDFFAVDYEYANGVHCESMCRQIDACDRRVSERLVGTKGWTDSTSGKAEIRSLDGEMLWRYEGRPPRPSKVQEHVDLIQSIRRDEGLNEARNIAESTLTAIMGRTSAYTGKITTWDQMMESDERLGPTEYAFGDVPETEVPLPGTSWPV